MGTPSASICVESRVAATFSFTSGGLALPSGARGVWEPSSEHASRYLSCQPFTAAAPAQRQRTRVACVRMAQQQPQQ